MIDRGALWAIYPGSMQCADEMTRLGIAEPSALCKRAAGPADAAIKRRWSAPRRSCAILRQTAIGQKPGQAEREQVARGSATIVRLTALSFGFKRASWASAISRSSVADISLALTRRASSVASDWRYSGTLRATAACSLVKMLQIVLDDSINDQRRRLAEHPPAVHMLGQHLGEGWNVAFAQMGLVGP